MSASIIQRKAAFATVTGSGSVEVTLDSAISSGSILVIAAATVQSNGSGASSPISSFLIEDDKGNGYGADTFQSSGSGLFANAGLNLAVTPEAGAQAYTFSFTAPTGQSAYTFLAGLGLYELTGVSLLATNESASQSLTGFHKVSDLSASISALSGGSFGNFLVSIFASIFSSSLTDANQVAAGSGWTLDGREAINGAFSPMAIAFQSAFVDPSSNPAATFSGSANNTELDGTILVGAYSLSSAISGGGSGGSGGGGSSTVFLGAITEVGSDPDDNGVFLGTVSVISQAPSSGVPVPYLGKVRIVTAPAGRPNPTLGQVIVLGSAPANEANKWLGSVATS